jgi:tryptophan-rich sensory protein
MQMDSLLLWELLGMCFLLARLQVTSTNYWRSWYDELPRPNGSIFDPPKWLFGWMWWMLFPLTGLAQYLALEASGEAKESLLVTDCAVHASNLLLGLLWTKLFFGCGEVVVSALVALAALCASVALLFLHANLSDSPWLPCALYAPHAFWTAYEAFLVVALAASGFAHGTHRDPWRRRVLPVNAARFEPDIPQEAIEQARVESTRFLSREKPTASAARGAGASMSYAVPASSGASLGLRYLPTSWQRSSSITSVSQSPFATPPPSSSSIRQ